MTLLEGSLKDNIYVDFGMEVQFGSDQVYVDRPFRFATVTFELMGTPLLEEIADRIRLANGHRPIHSKDKYTDKTCDQDGWYDFFIALNDVSPLRIDNCIEFVVVDSDADDNEEKHTIDLSQVEQERMYARLDEQCRGYLGERAARNSWPRQGRR